MSGRIRLVDASPSSAPRRGAGAASPSDFFMEVGTTPDDAVPRSCPTTFRPGRPRARPAGWWARLAAPANLRRATMRTRDERMFLPRPERRTGLATSWEVNVTWATAAPRFPLRPSSHKTTAALDARLRRCTWWRFWTASRLTQTHRRPSLVCATIQWKDGDFTDLPLGALFATRTTSRTEQAAERARQRSTRCFWRAAGSRSSIMPTTPSTSTRCCRRRRAELPRLNCPRPARFSFLSSGHDGEPLGPRWADDCCRAAPRRDHGRRGFARTPKFWDFGATRSWPKRGAVAAGPGLPSNGSSAGKPPAAGLTWSGDRAEGGCVPRAGPRFRSQDSAQALPRRAISKSRSGGGRRRAFAVGSAGHDKIIPAGRCRRSGAPAAAPRLAFSSARTGRLRSCASGGLVSGCSVATGPDDKPGRLDVPHRQFSREVDLLMVARRRLRRSTPSPTDPCGFSSGLCLDRPTRDLV